MERKIVMRGVRKIHFINRIDRDNVGDWNCSPLEFYYNYFNNYNLIRHDIGSIDYNEIDKEDMVILGGGGLFNVLDSFNLAINKVLELCDHVIAWSCGFNTHNGRLQADTDFTPLDFDKFMLVTIRDYNHPSGIEYLPCPTVKALCLDRTRTPIRKFGVIYHRSMPEISELPFDSISNNESITRINDFILDSEAIVTNSYHCAYWAILLERKAIVVNQFSSKFEYFKYKPELVEISMDDKDGALVSIKRAFDNAYVYKGVIDEDEKLNDSFFEKVRGIIESSGFSHSNDYMDFYSLSVAKDLRFVNLQGEVSMLNNGLTWLYDRIDKLVQLEQSCIQREQVLEKRCVDLQMCITKQLIQQIAKGKRVALAGCGVHTYKLLELLNGETEISCIAAKEHRYNFSGIQQVSYEEITQIPVDIIIVSSFLYRTEIIRELRELSLSADIIDLYSELEKNALPLRREFWLV
ncbi:MAG: polysaccharide pyruvyl transferase family protein [Lachnospiraceae bacterium]|nr:polysaccharide pyruvyl transferase family protein [Lachnospiraceae bacterium]